MSFLILLAISISLLGGTNLLFKVFFIYLFLELILLIFKCMYVCITNKENPEEVFFSEPKGFSVLYKDGEGYVIYTPNLMSESFVEDRPWLERDCYLLKDYNGSAFFVFRSEVDELIERKERAQILRCHRKESHQLKLFHQQVA